ncbi:MAG TPA: DNA polymerase III subunit beta [Trebonia sp.]|jgi:DNA polymerase-3 subunit beta|nr:DNA polymerase III subunit beta [Trebonia sp.]
MKFTVERDALAEAATWVARALPARPVIPVLAGLLLHATDDGLTLSCFDYEVSARMRIPAEVSEPGTALVPGRLLVEITRSLPDRPVDFGPDPEGLSMTCGEAAFTVATLPPEDYPELPELPQLAGTADGGALATAIGQVTPAASRDDTLPLLTAVNVELDAGGMTLAATDRYRLAVRELEWQPAPGSLDHGRISVMVPARTMSDAARMMSAAEAVRIFLRHDDAADDAMIGFETGERRLTTRLLAGEFVRYRSRFPEEFGCTADLPAGAFTEALRRVALVAERGTPVQLSFGRGRVTIVAGTQGQARARESVPADFAGDQPEIAFSPHYLLDGIVAAASAVAVASGAGAGKASGAAAESVSAASDSGASDSGAPHSAEADEAMAGVLVRLQFTSASKAAVISQSAAAEAGEISPFRYLVVPQRTVQ